jgi:hypothetical protein
LRLGFVPGVVPHKWASRFRTRFGAEALDMGRILPDDAGAALAADQLDAALMPLPVNKDVFHAIPLYTETDEESGRVFGREIGLVWLRDLEHPLMEPLTGIVRGRTANSSRGEATAPAPAASTGAPSAAKPNTGGRPVRPAKPADKKVKSSTKAATGKNNGRRRHRGN